MVVCLRQVLKMWWRRLRYVLVVSARAVEEFKVGYEIQGFEANHDTVVEGPRGYFESPFPRVQTSGTRRLNDRLLQRLILDT